MQGTPRRDRQLRIAPPVTAAGSPSLVGVASDHLVLTDDADGPQTAAPWRCRSRQGPGRRGGPHSGGTLVPNYYAKFLGGAAMIDDYVAIAPFVRRGQPARVGLAQPDRGRRRAGRGWSVPWRWKRHDDFSNAWPRGALHARIGPECRSVAVLLDGERRVLASPRSVLLTQRRTCISPSVASALRPVRWLGELEIAALHLAGHHLEDGVLGPTDGPGWVPAVHREGH